MVVKGHRKRRVRSLFAELTYGFYKHIALDYQIFFRFGGESAIERICSRLLITSLTVEKCLIANEMMRAVA